MVQVHAGPQRSNRGVGVVQEGVVEIVLLLGVSSRQVWGLQTAARVVCLYLGVG